MRFNDIAGRPTMPTDHRKLVLDRAREEAARLGLADLVPVAELCRALARHGIALEQAHKLLAALAEEGVLEIRTTTGETGESMPEADRPLLPVSGRLVWAFSRILAPGGGR